MADAEKKISSPRARRVVVKNYQRICLALLLFLCYLQTAQADSFSITDNTDKSYNFGGKDILDDTKADFDKKRARQKDLDAKSLDALGAVDSNNTPDRNEPFDGSEFKLSPFKEENFTKSPFSELFQTPKIKKDAPYDKNLDFTSGDTDKDALSEIDKERMKREMFDKDKFKEFIKPVYSLPGAWLPSGIDPVWNGGFTTPPDNGSPVPYRLDGHVDLQKGLPWDKSN